MYLVIPERTINTNIETFAVSCTQLAMGQYLAADSPHQAFRLPEVSVTTLVLCSKISDVPTSAVLILPLPIPLLFTSINPTEDSDVLLSFIRGAFRAARDVWSNVKKPSIDFDRDGIFYRRPFGPNEALASETVVLCNLPQQAGEAEPLMLPDLLLCGFGQRDEGLPRLESFRETFSEVLLRMKSHVNSILRSLENPEKLIPFKTAEERSTPVVTTLSSSHSPMWLSYDQWMRKLEGTAQGNFIRAQIEQPQRVDGPAGSGKTLSLVLKCLTTLKAAEDQGIQHHAALVVFSEETRSKIIEAFLSPLDEWGFHRRERSGGAAQTLTVTTLLAWSRSELRSVVGQFELSADNPSEARQDQYAVVRDVLTNHLQRLATAAKTSLSQDLRILAFAGVNPVLVRMFAHEFGVVIKGMADSSLRRYLTINRPSIGLPCVKEADRRLVYALFERYEEQLKIYGVVDLDDVAVSHIKLLQMPLRRDVREKLAFDSVFVDEAHSFNPNELAIFFLLTRRSELPPLVVAVDLPQSIGDKGYDSGGLEEAMFKDFEARERVSVQRFDLKDVHRCSQPILDLASSIYAQGHEFLASVRVPGVLNSTNKTSSGTLKPIIKGFDSSRSMMEGVLAIAELIVAQLGCSRSDILIVLMNESLDEAIPKSLNARSETVTKRTDIDAERRAHRANHFVIARPDYLHGLEYEAAILVGVSRNEVPRLDQGPLGSGAAAVFETQRAVDLLYLALTRARRQVALLYQGEPSFLLKDGIERELVQAVK